MLTPDPVIGFGKDGFTVKYVVNPELSHVIISENFEDPYAPKNTVPFESGDKVPVRGLEYSPLPDMWDVVLDVKGPKGTYLQFDVNSTVAEWVYENDVNEDIQNTLESLKRAYETFSDVEEEIDGTRGTSEILDIMQGVIKRIEGDLTANNFQ